MTIEAVHQKVDKIRNAAGDDEVAHNLEDGLIWDFVHHAAENSTDPKIKEMALAVMETKKVLFERWCA